MKQSTNLNDTQNLLSEDVVVPEKSIKDKLKGVLQHPSHVACADFEQSNFMTVDSECLKHIRIGLLIPMVGLSVYIMITKPKDWFLMESYWGFNLSLISCFCSLMVHYSKWWQTAAVFSSELSWGFNIMIVPAYWNFEWRNFIRDYMASTAAENIEYATAATVHTSGMVCSIIELCFVKMVFLKQDCKYSFIFALLYIPINYFGGVYIYGHPVYYQNAWVNWSRPWVTLGVWVG